MLWRQDRCVSIAIGTGTAIQFKLGLSPWERGNKQVIDFPPFHLFHNLNKLLRRKYANSIVSFSSCSGTYVKCKLRNNYRTAWELSRPKEAKPIGDDAHPPRKFDRLFLPRNRILENQIRATSRNNNLQSVASVAVPSKLIELPSSSTPPCRRCIRN